MFAKKLNSCMFLLKRGFYWLKYKIFSNSLHGTHSPFVYKFLEEVVYDNKEYIDYKRLNELKNKYENLTIKNSSNSRFTIDNNPIPITKKHRLLLYRIVKYFKPNLILELSSSSDIVNEYVSIAHSQSKIISLYSNDFDNILSSHINQFEGRELIYFDGTFKKDITLKYFYESLKRVSSKSVFVFNRICGNDDMIEVWNEIKNNPHVKVTIDFFDIGIVFFREEQVKENFIINY